MPNKYPNIFQMDWVTQQSTCQGNPVIVSRDRTRDLMSANHSTATIQFITPVTSHILSLCYREIVIISALSSGSNFMPFDVTLSECFMTSQGTKHHLNSVREAHEINGTIMKCCYQPRHSVHPASYCRLHLVLPTVRCHEPIKWTHCGETVSVCSHISLNTNEKHKRIMRKPCLCLRIFRSKHSNKINALRGNRVCVFAGFNTFEQNTVNCSILKAFSWISLWSA